MTFRGFGCCRVFADTPFVFVDLRPEFRRFFTTSERDVREERGADARWKMCLLVVPW